MGSAAMEYAAIPTSMFCSFWLGFVGGLPWTAPEQRHIIGLFFPAANWILSVGDVVVVIVWVFAHNGTRLMLEFCRVVFVLPQFLARGRFMIVESCIVVTALCVRDHFQIPSATLRVNGVCTYVVVGKHPRLCLGLRSSLPKPLTSPERSSQEAFCDSLVASCTRVFLRLTLAHPVSISCSQRPSTSPSMRRGSQCLRAGPRHVSCRLSTCRASLLAANLRQAG